jgi:DNA replication protein DnaC
MLNTQTTHKLRALKLTGMLEAIESQAAQPDLVSLSFDERFGLLVDYEYSFRENRRLARLLKDAKLKHQQASIEDIDFNPRRGLDKSYLMTLANCDWIQKRQHLIFTGPAGAGKTWLACAYGHQACRQAMPVIYKRVPRLLEELKIARGDGSIVKFRTQLAKVNVLILDDWGMVPIDGMGLHDLLELVDDRVNTGSLVITSQLPVSTWHEYLGEPTIADAILDRIVHNAHKIEVNGESMRRSKNKLL